MKKSILLLTIIFLSIKLSAQCVNTSLVSVKTTRSGNYEYVIFTFKGTVAPTFSISTVTPPFTEDPSDLPITVIGCKFRALSFQGGTYCQTTQSTSNLPFTVVKDVKRSGQFEGHYSYLLGLRCSQNNFIQYTYRAGSTTKRVFRFRR